MGRKYTVEKYAFLQKEHKNPQRGIFELPA